MNTAFRSTLATALGLAFACSSPTPPNGTGGTAGTGTLAGGGTAGDTSTGMGGGNAGAAAGAGGNLATSGAGGAPAVMAGAGGMDAMAGAGGSTGVAGAFSGPATLLSQTGLYQDIAGDVLAPGVLAYHPQFELWSDGAAKRRWLYVPPGTQIDNTNPDEWKFPIGTKVWKEFSRDGVRIETRMIEKLPEERASEGFEGWLTISFVWNDDLSDATATPDGLENAKGTDHDVPAQDACGRCHDMRKEKPLGVSALQLSHDGDGATLLSLSAAGVLKVPATANLVVPGDDATRAVLGYLHANCGHCHRARTPANNRVSSMLLWLESDSIASVEETPAYGALVNHFTESSQGSILTYRIAGGDPESSEIIRRMNERGDTAIMVDGEEIRVPMPPLASELVDTDAVAKVRAWIETLPVAPAAGAGAGGAPGEGVGGAPVGGAAP